MNKPVELPTGELFAVGEKLQQAIVLTKVRAQSLKSSRTKARADRVLRNAEELFRRVSETVQSTQRLTGFVERAFGVTVEDIFGLTNNARAVKGAAYTGMALVIRKVENTIDEIAEVNRAIDREVERG